MDDTVSYIFKVEFDGDLRRFVLTDLSFQAMEQRTREIFVFSEEQQIRFHHLDTDGNLVAVTADTNLKDIHATTKTSPKIIRLFIDVTIVALPETKKPFVEEPVKVDKVPEPQNEAAEPEVVTPVVVVSPETPSTSSVPPRKLTILEKKKQVLARLSSTRSRLTQRHQHLIEQCERVEQKAVVVAGRLDNVDRRILNILNKYPDLAASFPELDLEEAVPEMVMDRSRSNLFCDSCDIGILANSEVHFHCDICGNFDLCVRCERQFGHEHELLRIEQGTRRLPAFFDLSFDNEVRTLEACCLDVWHELEASGLLCPRNLAILMVISLLSLVMALSTAYAVCSAIFSVVH